MQLDLFEKDELKLLWEDHEKLRKTCDNVRRGLFARHNELAKMYLELKQEVDQLKQNLAQKNSTEIYDFFTQKIG